MRKIVVRYCAVFLLAFGRSLRELNLFNLLPSSKVERSLRSEKSKKAERKLQRNYRKGKYRKRRYFREKSYRLKGTKAKDSRYSNQKTLRRMYRNC